ncbi:zinc finger protein 761 [Aedes albopictus]|uniref:Uncharacterized protein n=1 Tax=Aedes albopictus TaxID=7160 RepID=A0ABM1XMU6_AEDAL
MDSMAMKEETDVAKDTHRICRLCLNIDSLEDVFKEEGLHQWISEYLSITISSEDSLSHAVCAVCRVRLTEFHQFHMHCHEVQDELQSRNQNEVFSRMEANRDLSTFNSHLKLQMAPHHNCDPQYTPISKNSTKTFVPNPTVNEPMTDLEDMIDIGDVKIEPRSDDDVGISDELIDQSSKLSSEFDNDNTKDSKETPKARRDKTVPCNICHKKYRNKLLLWSHNRTAHGPKNYKCKICGNQFAHRPDLDRHNRTKRHLAKLQKHVEEQELNKNDSPLKETKGAEYSCPTCNKKFNRQCQFKSHVKSHDTEIEDKQSSDVEETESEDMDSDNNTPKSSTEKPSEPKENKVYKPWKCNECRNSYSDEAQLRRHKIFHKPKKRKCPICEKPFRHLSTMEKHIPTHNAARKWPRTPTAAAEEKKEERPHKCDICQKTFKAMSAIYCHKIQVHGPKVHGCHICDFKFSTRKNLVRHIQRHYRSNAEMY